MAQMVKEEGGKEQREQERKREREDEEEEEAWLKW